MISEGPWLPCLVDDLKHVTVHRLTEKKALMRGRSHRFDEFPASLRQTLLQARKIVNGMIDRDVPAEFAFKPGDFESFDKSHMHFLATPNVQPDGGDG